MLNNNVISWKTRKQPTPSLSSTEAEYKSLCDLVKKIMWLKILLKKVFNLQIQEPTQIFEDNQGAIDFAQNDMNA